MKTVELDLSKFFDGNKQTATIKKLNIGQIIEIKDNLPMAIDKISGIPREQEGLASLMLLQAALISVPMEKEGKIVQVSNPTLADVKTLDLDLGTYLVEEVLKLNGLSPN